jgi:organic radical activating enzyme
VTAKIVEIFKSIQGEGIYTGVKQVFVRFFGCNMDCVWCDTPEARKEMLSTQYELSPEEVFHQICLLWDRCHSVCLTGGEPLLHKDFMRHLLPLLKEAGMTTYLETNAICYEALTEVINGIDIIAMDIKLPSSTKKESFWHQHEEFLRCAVKKQVFIKAIISSTTEQKDIEKMVDLICSVDPTRTLILQPNSFELHNGVLERCFEFQNYCMARLAHVRILPQVHRLLNIR